MTKWDSGTEPIHLMLSEQNRSSWRSGRTRILHAGIVIAAFLVALGFARYTLATRFADYDDEGYILLSFRHYFAGEQLYTRVASDYGPFSFFAEKALFEVLRLPVNHDAGRLVTLICWMMAAVLAGYFTYQFSKNTILATASGLATMLLGKVLANEPGHPQQLILPILILACCASMSRRRMSLLLLGVLGALLFFTKINVGVFYFFAIAQVLLCEFPAGLMKKLGAGFLFTGAVFGPLILMREDLHTWAGNYCALTIVCGVSTLAAALLTAPSSTKQKRTVLYVASGALLATALIVAETVREGMSFATLAEGIFWGPLRHPQVFAIPFELSGTSLVIAVLVTAGIAGTYWFRDRWRIQADLVDGLRCLAGVSAIFLLATHLSYTFDLAFLPLGLIPPKDRSWQPREYFPRLFVTILAASQSLQAYPVAASQRSIGAAPLLLWGFLCVHDGAGGVLTLLRRGSHWFEQHPFPVESAVGGLVAITSVAIMIGLGVWPERYPTPALPLPGAESLHLPRDVENQYESLAANIRANCSMLFTLPGLGSLNFWSGVPTPNGMTLPSWVSALSVEQQEQILHILEADPRSCVVYNEELARVRGATNENLGQSPLARYILLDSRKVYEHDGDTIYANPQRKSSWIEAVTAPAH